MASVLLVDDNCLIREELQELLERTGYDVRIADDGDSATRMYREAKADLVIIDMMMMEKNSADTIWNLRNEFPEIKTIIISGGGQIGALTCKPDALQAAKFLAAAESVGANAALPKPFSTGELLCTIQSLVG